jgi:hypothetical protein
MQIANFYGACIPCFKLGETTSVEQDMIESSLFKLYPNPSDGRLTLEISSAQTQNLLIVVSDLMGKIAYTNDLNLSAMGGSKNELDLSFLTSGIYLIQVSSGKEVFNRKLIIE